MLEYKVVKLVNQYTRALLIRQTVEEAGVVDHFKIAIFVDPHASGGNGGCRLLLDAPRKRGEEWLRLKQSVNMVIELEVGHYVFRRHRVHKEYRHGAYTVNRK